MSWSHNSSKSRNVASTSTTELLAVNLSNLVLVFAPGLEPTSSRCLSLLSDQASWLTPFSDMSVQSAEGTISSIVAYSFRRQRLVIASTKTNMARSPKHPQSILNRLPITRLDSRSRTELLSIFSLTPSNLFPNVPTCSLPFLMRASN